MLCLNENFAGTLQYDLHGLWLVFVTVNLCYQHGCGLVYRMLGHVHRPTSLCNTTLSGVPDIKWQCRTKRAKHYHNGF